MQNTISSHTSVSAVDSKYIINIKKPVRNNAISIASYTSVSPKVEGKKNIARPITILSKSSPIQKAMLLKRKLNMSTAPAKPSVVLKNLLTLKKKRSLDLSTLNKTCFPNAKDHDLHSVPVKNVNTPPCYVSVKNDSTPPLEKTGRNQSDFQIAICDVRSLAASDRLSNLTSTISQSNTL